MNLDWTLAAADPVTLVRARLGNERATPREVRLRNCLDGPVLPPRCHGMPEAGWDRDGVTVVVPAGETVALGYACPAPETEPPVVVDNVGPVAGEETPGDTLDTALRELGDHRPPRDVLGADAEVRPGETTPQRAAAGEIPPNREQGTEADAPPSPRSGYPRESLSAGAQKLLGASRTRVETAEALGAVSVRDATALLDTNDGLTGVESLGEELDADAQRLRALAAAAATLAARAEAATPRTEALRRLS